MTRRILGQNAKSEIRESITRCRTSKEIAAEVERWSAHFGVRKDRIYAITKDVRPQRKIRADKGDRRLDIRTDENLKLVAGWVDLHHIKTSDAILLARARGIDLPITFTTLDRYLRENGLDKKSRRSLRTPHVRMEAKAPGQRFQFDISGTKERWFDVTTRKILSVSTLEVSKNHPNTKASRVRVWRFSLIDDYSRRVFVRYFAVEKPNSSHVVDFLLMAYDELGVPLELYTDNDVVIKFGRNRRATEILNKVLRDQGGYENIFHLPGNARATGKAERLHSTVEQEEKFIGLYLAERGDLSIDVMNKQFAIAFQNRKNYARHSETGEQPMARWESTFSVIRRLDYATLRSAFMADEFEVRLRGDLTFRLNRQTFQLPTTDRYPFADWVGQKLRVVFHDDHPFFTVIGLDGVEYDIDKEPATLLVAGEEFKSPRQTNAETLRKEIRAKAKEDAAAIKRSGETQPIPYFDIDFAPEAGNTNVTPLFRNKPETTIEPERIAEVAPGRVAASHNPAINFWEAVRLFESDFATKSECKQFMDTLFASRDEECWLLRSEVEDAIEQRSADTPVRHLRAV